MCRFQNRTHQQFWWNWMENSLPHKHALAFWTLFSLPAHPPSLISCHSFLFLRAIIPLTLASPRIPFESHIMSNMQLRAHQQLPDTVTLTKTSMACSCSCSHRAHWWPGLASPRLASPTPLSDWYFLMCPTLHLHDSTEARRAAVSLSSCFSHARPPVITSSFY